EGYRRPYVDQGVLELEKSIGSAWKASVVYTNRRNGDIVGLKDRNLATNYYPMHQVSADNLFAPGSLVDAHGKPLVLPVVYVAYNDLLAAIAEAEAGFRTAPWVGRIDPAIMAKLQWKPDVVLTAVPEAKRRYQ